VVWRLGDGLAGVGVLIVASYFHAAPQKASWITLAAVLLWGIVAVMARKTYVSSLREIVQGLRPQKQVAEFAEARVSKNFNRSNVEKILALEIAQHYRSYQVLQQLSEITTGFPERIAELQHSMRLESGRIFRLLAILYPQSDIESTYAAIRSGVPVIRDSALELMENTLQPELRRLLVPLFDETLSVGQRARLAARVLEGDTRLAFAG
jgi:hypothetical protein